MGAQSKHLVILRPVAEGYQVAVEPPLPDSGDRTRTFADKSEAWTYAQGLWTDHRLGLRDLTVSNTLRIRPPHGPYRKHRADVIGGQS